MPLYVALGKMESENDDLEKFRFKSPVERGLADLEMSWPVGERML
jgi:hypothetical protein